MASATIDMPSISDTHLHALSAALGNALTARGYMLTVAESCTGGMLAQTITAVAGSSAWFNVGFVTYSNASKHTILSVSEHTLIQHGAVSEQTALQMANGALKVVIKTGETSTSLINNTVAPKIIAASITGIAGPDGGTASKPVGTVCFGFAQASHCFSSTQLFKGDRENIRKQSTEYALKQLLQLTLTIEI